MKINKPVSIHNVLRGSEKWKEVIEALTELPSGMALPVECEDKKEALSLQSFILQRNRSGWRYTVRRNAATVYISKVEEPALKAVAR